MLLHQHRPGLRIRLEQLRDAPRHGEAGPLVGQPDGLVAERLGGELPARGDEVSAMTASGCVWSTCGARTNACRSVSIDGRGVSGSSAQRSRYSTISASSIASRLAQRQDLVEPQGGEAARRDRGQVGAGALDPEDAGLAAGVVEDAALRGGVAAAMLASARSAPSRFER